MRKKMIELIKEIKLEEKKSAKEHDKHERSLNNTRIKAEYETIKKRLHNDLKLNFWQITSGYGVSVKELSYELKEYKQSNYSVPKNLITFLKFSSSTGGRFCFFGQNLNSFGIADNEVIRNLIDDDIFPAFMIRFLVLGDCEGGSIGTWLYDNVVEDSEILFLDYEEQTIQIVSNSMKNFTQRALKCYHEDIEQDYFEPSDKALEIIREIDGDNVLPDSYTYSLSFTEDWLEHWQEIIKD